MSPPTEPDDAPDLDLLHIAALARVWAQVARERPPRCAICGAVAALDPDDRWQLTHDPVPHGWTPPDPTYREPSPDALDRVRRSLGERDPD